MNLRGALQWLLDPPWRYEFLAVLAGALPLALALAACARERTRRPADPHGSGGGWFAASILVALCAFRWPGFFHHPELNVDEAQTVAGAITLQFDPVYWRSVDGATHGPLNDFVLLLPRLVGLPVNFATARLVGVLLVAGALAAFWFGARILWGEAAGRLAVLPPLAFFAFSTFWDFVHYTSEHLPIFLLTAAWAAQVAAGSRPLPGRMSSAWRWALAGLLLGAIPLAKMQGAPPALVLVAFGIGSILEAGAPDHPARRRMLTAFGAGLLLPAILCGLHLRLHHLGHDFWQSYVLNNLRYSTETKMFSLAGMVRQLPGWLPDAEGFAPYALGLGGFVVAALASGRGFGLRAWRHAGLAAIMVAAALYAAIAPGRVFHHYLLFTVIPLAGLGASLLAAWMHKSSAWVAISVFLVLGLGPQVAAKLRRPNPFLGDLRSYPQRRSAVAVEVLRYAHCGEPLGIWGYMPRYYVETGLPQASREGHNERQLIPQPQSAYYRARYLADLERNRPPVFLDAVGPQAFWPHDRLVYGHETWPELHDWVSRNYRQVDDIEGVRIYVRIDRTGTR